MTKGQKIIEEINEKKKELKDEKNHDRNLTLKTIGLTLVCVFVVEGSFALGWIIKG